MPYLSDAELSELARVEPSETAIEAATPSVMPMLGGMTTAAVMGFVRAKLEDPATGQWNIPGTRWDAEAVSFLALAAVAFGGQYVGLDDYRGYAALGAIGVGCHYAGEVARNYGRTGKMDFHVGGNGGVPPWDPSSFDPTQFGDPYADAQARGLSESGV
jgi:hypothetical protein